MKNYTPFQIILVTSLVSSLIIGLLYRVFNVFIQVDTVYLLLIFTVLAFLIIFLSFRYSIEKFINRRIKLIYKLIHSLKTSNSEPTQKVDLQTDIFAEINKEVNDWAESKKDEVSELKKMGDYRRDFLANVSHELKTPIFNIQGYLNTLAEGGLFDENINVPYLEKAINNLDNLSNIINDLEIITRLESGQLPVKSETFDIYSLVLKEIELVELIAAGKKIKVEVKEGCKISRQVLGDKEKIHQVMQNLLNNSINYGKKGGKTQIGLYDMYDHVLIEVSDNGIGIEKKHISHLIERFYRVDKDRSRKSGGSGLGLAIVKHILEAHNEILHIRSTPGVGSTFGFSLKKT